MGKCLKCGTEFPSSPCDGTCDDCEPSRMLIGKPDAVALFPNFEVLKREWGTEEVYTVPGKYCMKRITMKKNSEGGLQKHHLKDETGYIIYGSAVVTYADANNDLVSCTLDYGDLFHFPTGAIHKIRALTDFCYIEAGTPHYNDRVHCESDYGLETETGGLPSTKLEDVISA